MIGSSVSGNLPRTQELIAKTRAYDRAKLSDEELEAAYVEASKRVILLMPHWPPISLAQKVSTW